jgi:hypothetical protein
MEPEPVHRAVVTLRAVSAALALCLTAASASAQVELTGSWAPLNHEDMSTDSLPVDYMGLPLNDEGRLRALSYSDSQLSMIERQCEGWPAFYLVTGPFGLKIWADTEPAKGTVVSYTIGAWEDRAPLVIWMDGRAHPSANAEHTRGGFTTGHWEGTTLVARTTHIKEGFLRKTGPPSSDEATFTTRFYRHGDILTLLVVVEDPIYLSEPQIWTKSFELSVPELAPVGPPCISTFEGTAIGNDVPHYVPEKNPFVDEMTMKYGVPREAALGYPETLYPEYRRKMKAPAAPQKSKGR